jgi:hypothetical protein
MELGLLLLLRWRLSVALALRPRGWSWRCLIWCVMELLGRDRIIIVVHIAVITLW